MNEYSKTLKTIKEYLIITLGMFLYCVSWTHVLIPNEVSGGGVPGISTVLYFATGWDYSYYYIIINTFLVVTGTLIMGHGFGLKTLYSIFLGFIFLRFLPDLIPYRPEISEKLINAVVGGTVSGLGIALVFMQGGSSGGTDIVAIVLAKFRDISPGKVFLICDMIIIGSIFLLPDKTLEDVIYGYIQMVSFSYMVDLVLTGNKQSVQILVFSQKYKEIADRLTFDMHRGVTALDSVGWYTQHESKVLIVVVRRQFMLEVTTAVKEIDPQAFLSVTTTMSVYGNGFEQIKSKNITWKNQQAKKS